MIEMMPPAAVIAVDLLIKETIREKVYQAEAILKALPQVEMLVTHHFAKGVYGRELFIPKDTILTGKIHKYSQLNILSQGEISVLTEEGIKRVKAPFHIVSPPGTKRIAYAHEDCVWTTVHGTFETDLEKIEDYLIAQSEDEYLEFKALLLEGKACLG